jgi:hypothetical protein
MVTELTIYILVCLGKRVTPSAPETAPESIRDEGGQLDGSLSLALKLGFPRLKELRSIPYHLSSFSPQPNGPRVRR